MGVSRVSDLRLVFFFISSSSLIVLYSEHPRSSPLKVFNPPLGLRCVSSAETSAQSFPVRLRTSVLPVGSLDAKSNTGESFGLGRSPTDLTFLPSSLSSQPKIFHIPKVCDYPKRYS